MNVGIPKEIKADEYRVAVTPAGVRELMKDHNRVFVESDAGVAAGFADAAFEAAGARVVPSADDVFDEAELIVKVKEPQATEVERLGPHHILFTYLHLAADPNLGRRLAESGALCIAYETVEADDGALPLLAPMSEIAGRLAGQEGASTLKRSAGGRGLLLGGVAGVQSANVVIIGAGVAGINAAAVAIALGGNVTILDRDLARLRSVKAAFGSACETLFSTDTAIESLLSNGDLIVGAVLIKGARAPRLITRTQLSLMRSGSVLVDVSIDQGGCFETSAPTTHSDPTFVVDDVVHYCVANIPSSVPVTATWALTNATLPFVTAIASLGVDGAIREMPVLKSGVNVAHSEITCAPVAAALGVEPVRVETVLGGRRAA